MSEMSERVSVVKLQRELGVPGPELMRAIVEGELSYIEGKPFQILVDPAEVAEFAKRYFATRGEPEQP